MYRLLVLGADIFGGFIVSTVISKAPACITAGEYTYVVGNYVEIATELSMTVSGVVDATSCSGVHTAYFR